MRASDPPKQNATSPAVEPLAAPIPAACLVAGISRTELYRALGRGDIKAVKMGRRTLILMDSLRGYLASLPTATFRAPRKAS